MRTLLAEKLAPVNEGRCVAESTLTVDAYVEKFFLPYIEKELKPSTANGYKGLWRMYLRAWLTKVTLRDFTCGQATRLLADIHRKHGLSRKSLRHCKGLLQTIFTHAKRNDVLAGENPVKDALIPRAAVAANKSHAYTVQEISTMLATLKGTAHRAVALMYFTGLRPGEARGAKWTDLDLERRVLNVRRSIWRKIETTPKTEESIAPVPVAAALAEILAKTPHASKFILATPSGKPIDLHNLAAREIVPTLEICAVCGGRKSEHESITQHEFKRDESVPVWRGFYALRRGIGTALADVDSAVAAKSVLRHSNLATTTAHYVKSVDEAAVRAMDKVNSLFDNSVSGRPN